MSAFPLESMKKDWGNLPNALSLSRALLSWVPALLLFLWARTEYLWLNIGAIAFGGVLMITDLLDADVQVLQTRFELVAARVSAQNKYYLLQNVIGTL